MRVFAASLLALTLPRQVAAADTCDAYLFAYFVTEELYYATSPDGLLWTPLNKGRPVLNTTVSGTSIRDPYVHAAVDNSGYYLVSTNGHGFGANPDILTWHTDDLIHYGPQHVVPVMDTSVRAAATLCCRDVVSPSH